MKFGKDATVLRLVGGIQAMEMQVTGCEKEFQAIAYAAAYFWMIQTEHIILFMP